MMKKYGLLILSFVPLAPLNGQEFVVMLEKMNVLYAGMENPFRATVGDIPQNQLVLTPSKGTVSRDSSGAWSWKICEYTASSVFLILSDSAGGKADTLYFRVKRPPEPLFRIVPGGYHSSGGISGAFEGVCGESMRPEIVGFELTVVPNRGDAYVARNSGARFSGNARDLMLRLKRGDRVYIDDIAWRAGCDPAVRKSDACLFWKVE